MRYKLIPKHATGNPINTNPLLEKPINTNLVPKKEDKKLKKSRYKTYTWFYNLAQR